jgi:hypothetical protein
VGVYVNVHTIAHRALFNDCPLHAEFGEAEIIYRWDCFIHRVVCGLDYIRSLEKATPNVWQKATGDAARFAPDGAGYGSRNSKPE